MGHIPGRNLWLIGLLVGSMAAIGLAACGGNESSKPSGTSGAGTSSGSASSSERITIDGAGEALVWGEGKGAVLLSHGAAFDASSWQSQAERIAAAGYLVVAPEDVLTAVGFLRAAGGATDVALIGASAGADTSLEALSTEPDAVDQLITLSVNSTREGLGSEPKLFIASEDESVADLSTELAENAEGPDNQALILPGGAHAQAIFDGEQAESAVGAILEQLGGGAEDEAGAD
jgi:hypothetical protein